MKRAYETPSSEIIALSTEGLIAFSGEKHDEVSPGTQLTNRHGGWNADDWKATDEE